MSTKWDEGTLSVVRGVWAMFIATIMIAGSMFFVLPHLLEDKVFSRADLGLVGGIIVVALVASLPHIFIQLVVKGFNIWRKRRNGGSP